MLIFTSVWQWILEKLHSTDVFSGIGVTVLVTIMGFFLRKKYKNVVQRIKSGEGSDVKISQSAKGTSIVSDVSIKRTKFTVEQR